MSQMSAITDWLSSQTELRPGKIRIAGSNCRYGIAGVIQIQLSA